LFGQNEICEFILMKFVHEKRKTRTYHYEPFYCREETISSKSNLVVSMTRCVLISGFLTVSIILLRIRTKLVWYGCKPYRYFTNSSILYWT